MKREDIRIRFWRHVDKEGPIPSSCPELGNCWLWTGSTKGNNRYGAIRFANRMELAHRVAFFLKYGRWPRPNALHKCDNGLCIRATHLFEGTQKDNMRDCASKKRTGIAVAIHAASVKAAGRTSCVNGHTYTPDNVYLAINRNSPRYRQCRTCAKLRMRIYRSRKKSQCRMKNL